MPGRKPINEAQGHNYGVLSLEDVLIKSSNVGAIRIGDRVGSDRLLEYVHRFGFGQKLAPDFVGPVEGTAAAGPAERQRAGVDLDGLPNRRHAAADGDRGQRGRQRRVCWWSRTCFARVRSDGQRER